jgi:hypothetical protein
MLADGVGHAGALRIGGLRVRHVADFLVDGIYSIKRSQVLLGLLCGPAVGKSLKEDGLLAGYGGVHS